jgi:hypothetical protein
MLARAENSAKAEKEGLSNLSKCNEYRSSDAVLSLQYALSITEHDLQD